MVKGVLVAFGIMLGCLVAVVIPIAHFVLVPGGPFIGGYFGISFARSNTSSYAVKGLIFGCLFGALVLVVSALAVAIFTTLSEPSEKMITLLWIGVVVLTLYMGSMSTLGAMYASLKSGDAKALERPSRPQAL